MATGNSFRSLSYLYRISPTSICYIVRETCHHIYETLKDEHLRLPNENEWKQIALGYWDRWQSPNTIGSIDGKHIAIKKPRGSGTLYHNYKGFFSFVLLAVCDYRYRFTYIDVGSYGHNSDGGIFDRSAFKKAMDAKRLNLPPPGQLPGTNDIVPHFFLGDAAFPLMPNLQKPLPITNLTKEQRIFNYRISRGRMLIENSFGLLCARWRILLRTMETNVENSVKIVQAACVLHNFLCSRERGNNNPAAQADVGGQQNGAWRQHVPNELLAAQQPNRVNNRPRNEAQEVRSKLMTFYNNVGAVEWQDRMIE